MHNIISHCAEHIANRLAISGLKVAGIAGRTTLTTGGLTYDNVRGDQKPSLIHPTVT
jgi:hypothetical protein